MSSSVTCRLGACQKSIVGNLESMAVNVGHGHMSLGKERGYKTLTSVETHSIAA